MSCLTIIFNVSLTKPPLVMNRCSSADRLSSVNSYHFLLQRGFPPVKLQTLPLGSILVRMYLNRYDHNYTYQYIKH